jgi:hypothetical protein
MLCFVELGAAFARYFGLESTSSGGGLQKC